MKKKSFTELILTLPPIVWLSLFFLIPTLIVFLFAFKPYDVYGGIAEGWSFQAFKDIARSGYSIVMWRTFWMSVVTTVISLLLAIPVAYFIARVKRRYQAILLLLTILPFWSSFIVRVYAWKLMLHPEGLIKRILVFLHLASPDAILLYHPSTVIIVMVYSFLPFAILPLYSAASKFDFQLMEAAMDLGMTQRRAFYKVFLPGIRTGLITALLMVFIPSLGTYVIPDVLGGPQTEFIGNKIVQRTFKERNLPLASALSSILSIAVLVPMATIATIQSRVNRKNGEGKI